MASLRKASEIIIGLEVTDNENILIVGVGLTQ